MAELDLLNKFNRAYILSLVDIDIFKAVQMYREYIAYLKENNELNEELKLMKSSFLKKLENFVFNQMNKEKISELIPAYQELLSEFPNSVLLKINCSEIFSRLEQYDISIDLLKEASKTAPYNVQVKKLLFGTYNCVQDFKNAILVGKEIVELEGNALNYSELALCYNYLYDNEDNEENLKNAILNMEIAYKLNNNEKIILKNLIILYTKAKDDNKLKFYWNEFMKKFPMNGEDRFNYSAFLIRHGDFKKGFEFYESRFKHEKKPTEYPKIEKPLYSGKQNLSKSTLLIQSEQGLGDVFLFSRFIKQLKAKKIIFRVPDCVYEITKRSLKDIEVVPYSVSLLDLKFDYHLPLMSLPYVLGITTDDVIQKEKYFVSDENKVEEFKNKFFNNDKFKIGISFKGNEVGLKSRNIDLSYLLPLAKIDSVQVYSLQYREPEKNFKDTNIINLGNYLNDYDDTAAMIENLDLLVTIDNSTMNLAGALGKKSYCLFNYLPEFRWFDLDGENVKWYESIKPYQCKQQGDWSPVIEKIVSDIKEIIKWKF